MRLRQAAQQRGMPLLLATALHSSAAALLQLQLTAAGPLNRPWAAARSAAAGCWPWRLHLECSQGPPAPACSSTRPHHTNREGLWQLRAAGQAKAKAGKRWNSGRPTPSRAQPSPTSANQPPAKPGSTYRPGRLSAGSTALGRLVAPTTRMCPARLPCCCCPGCCRGAGFSVAVPSSSVSSWPTIRASCCRAPSRRGHSESSCTSSDAKTT
jgi:hypothetical protein